MKDFNNTLDYRNHLTSLKMMQDVMNPLTLKASPELTEGDKSEANDSYNVLMNLGRLTMVNWFAVAKVVYSEQLIGNKKDAEGKVISKWTDRVAQKFPGINPDQRSAVAGIYSNWLLPQDTRKRLNSQGFRDWYINAPCFTAVVDVKVFWKTYKDDGVKENDDKLTPTQKETKKAETAKKSADSKAVSFGKRDHDHSIEMIDHTSNKRFSMGQINILIERKKQELAELEKALAKMKEGAEETASK